MKTKSKSNITTLDEILDKKYGKKGMDKLRAAGRKHASKKTMQNIRAEFSDKEKPVKETKQAEAKTEKKAASKAAPKKTTTKKTKE